jgi:hypothetical protein
MLRRRMLCLTKHHDMKTYGGVVMELRAILNSAMDGNGQFHPPAALSSRKYTPVPPA